MRILTLVPGRESLDDVARLSDAIRSFNAEVDFRLRFLDIEIAEVFYATPELRPEIESRVARAEVREGPEGGDALLLAAFLALVMDRERPDVVVCVGAGELVASGTAAATAAGRKLAFFGAGRGRTETGMELGEDPAVAVERMSGVAREIV